MKILQSLLRRCAGQRCRCRGMKNNRTSLAVDWYVAVHGGVAPDAVTWESHLDMQLLPDYVVYNGGELLGWGFWDNRWKVQK